MRAIFQYHKDVTYIFIQAKTSSSFDTKEMHSFYFGVSDFFSENPQLPRNNDIKRLSELSEYILDRASDFKENPKCKTYFITTGVANEDQNISAVTQSSKDTWNWPVCYNKYIGFNLLTLLYDENKEVETRYF